MLFGCFLRSVGQRTCFPSACRTSRRGCRRVITGMQGKSFDDRVFATTRCKRHIVNTESEVRGRQQSGKHLQLIMANANTEVEYEAAIKALNTLQTNAGTIRRSIALKNKQIPLDDMVKYLNRSGLTLEELDKLSIIHVSGTKGKGSTCALTESILRENGAKTGFFSSPHLVSVTERIRIDGEPIAKPIFTKTFWRVYRRLQAAQEGPTDMPAYFKFLTILCFHIFLEERVDVCLLEVGIGGQLDCTNVIRNTKTVGITSLGLEHTQLLGETLAEIAWQKAGIIKPNANVYTSARQSECLQVIRQRAAEMNATLHIVPEFNDYMQDPSIAYRLKNVSNITKLNGSLAIELAGDWLRNKANGFPKGTLAPQSMQLTPQFCDGIAKCVWPGRCQLIEFFNFNIHLDGAHTVESMYVCSTWFEQVTESSTNSKILIFNTTGDRDSSKLLDILRHKSAFEMACFVPNIASGSRNKKDNQSVYCIAEQIKHAKLHAANWHLLCVESDEADSSLVCGSLLDAFVNIRKRYGSEKKLDVLVTGSLHLIGATVLALDELKAGKDH